MTDHKIPSSFHTAADVVERLNKKKCTVTEDIILGVANSGHLPCWRWHVNGEQGPPLFRLDEVFTWMERNWLSRQEGLDFPKSLRVYCQHDSDHIEPCGAHELPHALSLMAGQLLEVSGQWTGVYFLTLEDVVVYVGQSVSTPSRISTHRSEGKKVFERSFFLPVPENDLNAVEGAFIRALKPRYNQTAPGKEEWDESVLIHYCADLARILFNERARKGNLIKWPTPPHIRTDTESPDHYSKSVICWNCAKHTRMRGVVWVQTAMPEVGRCPFCATVLLEQAEGRGKIRPHQFYLTAPLEKI